MSNLNVNFKQIEEFAVQYGLPAHKSRAIIREFLQTKIITLIYTQKAARQLYFVGGTALRLLYGLDRFSEDLDFDAPKISREEIFDLLENVSKNLIKENYLHDFYKNKKEKKDYYEFRFINVLPGDEKLVIKLDFESFWKKQIGEAVFLNRYGLMSSVMTKTKGQFLVEKLRAFVDRERTEARDVYDMVWLFGQAVTPDEKFAKSNGFNLEKLLIEAQNKFAQENKIVLKNALRPFLLNEDDVNKIDFFEKCIKI